VLCIEPKEAQSVFLPACLQLRVGFIWASICRFRVGSICLFERANNVAAQRYMPEQMFSNSVFIATHTRLEELVIL